MHRQTRRPIRKDALQEFRSASKPSREAVRIPSSASTRPPAFQLSFKHSMALSLYPGCPCSHNEELYYRPDYLGRPERFEFAGSLTCTPKGERSHIFGAGFSSGNAAILGRRAGSRAGVYGLE